MLDWVNGYGQSKISPGSSYSHKICLNRSRRQQDDMRAFLNQKLRTNIIPSRSEETDFENSIKPRSTPFKLFGKTDVELKTVLKEHTPPSPPPKLDLRDGYSEEERIEEINQRRKKVTEYVNLLLPPVTALKFPQYPEGRHKSIILLSEPKILLLVHFRFEPKLSSYFGGLRHSHCSRSMSTGS